VYNASSAANSFSMIACRVVTQKFYAVNASPSRQDGRGRADEKRSGTPSDGFDAG
jgi:hypothetical protein